jgi:hypothetical protein
VQYEFDEAVLADAALAPDGADAIQSPTKAIQCSASAGDADGLITANGNA